MIVSNLRKPIEICNLIRSIGIIVLCFLMTLPMGRELALGSVKAPVLISPSADHILYVNQHVSGGNQSGDSWGNAIPDLADALQWAQANKDKGLWDAANPLRIYVSIGEYKPGIHPATNVATTDRNAAFLMVKDVQLYGGFDPANGITDLSHSRILPPSDGTAKGTILLGESSSGVGVYHVVISAGDVATALIDGFTITGGNANGSNSITVNGLYQIRRDAGGGMYHMNSSPTLTNVTISGNVATSTKLPQA